MKKLISLLLALVMVLSLSTVAFADETTYPNDETVTITKIYEAENEGTTSPEETFNFTIEARGVTDAAEGVTTVNMPMPSIGNVNYTSGQAGSANKSKDITITLPEYNSVGIYTYTIKETAGNTAGVEYYGKDILLKVTVIEQNGKIRVAAVHTEDGFNGTGNDKKDEFANTYKAGSLSVKKNVTGNLGDKSKEFKVTVTFTAPEGKTVNEAISYTDGTAQKTIATTAWKDGKATAEIMLIHDETVTFTNIPYGVTYTVVEDDYTKNADGTKDYDAAQYSEFDGEINSDADNVTITNNKDGQVDTGVMLDSLPYIMVLAFVAIAGVALISKKRYNA